MLVTFEIVNNIKNGRIVMYQGTELERITTEKFQQFFWVYGVMFDRAMLNY